MTDIGESGKRTVTPIHGDTGGSVFVDETDVVHVQYTRVGQNIKIRAHLEFLEVKTIIYTQAYRV